MEQNTPIFDLIGRWPSRADLAGEIGVKTAVVHKWATHGRIPSRHQAAVVRAAQERGWDDITAEWMLNTHGHQATRGEVAS